jgi:heat-inducible transcriptional repressor
MSDRRDRILHLVAESYIRTAQPVASARIAERLDLSSATVRSEFGTLEHEGFLQQPHTSAGRIPTPRGFSRYAARFLPPRPLTSQARRFLASRFATFHGEALLRQLAQTTAELTGYAVVVSLPADDRLHAHEIHLSQLSDRTVMAVVVLENGMVRQLRVAVDPAPTDAALDDAERSLRQLTLPLREVPGALRRLARSADPDLERTLTAIASAWPDVAPERSASAGLRRLLDEPESRDPHFVRLVIDTIERPAVAPAGDGGVMIDTDESLALVKASVRVGDSIGALTLVGPARLRYATATRVVRGVSDALGASDTD